LAEAEEEAATVHAETESQIVDEEGSIGAPTKERKKGKSKEHRDSESEKDILREKRKLKEVEETREKPLKPKSSRNALQPIDSNGALHSLLHPTTG
jgi:hypothetical protein